MRRKNNQRVSAKMANGRRIILWDFDGTLVPFTSWRSALMDVLDECEPGHHIGQEQIRPFLRDGFPWHKPQEPHTHLTTPEAWRTHLEPVFVRAYLGVGFNDQRAQDLARQVRKHMTNPKRFVLLEDTLPTLKYLIEQGWSHGILSNRMPELPEIVRAIGLNPFIDFCLTSGVTGYEKPNPQSFRLALSQASNPEKVWMVGDNVVSDIKGAEDVGITAILVHHPPTEGVKYCAADLQEVVKIIEAGSRYTAPS
jgi:putative hydrolase of the HAD superfamily